MHRITLAIGILALALFTTGSTLHAQAPDRTPAAKTPSSGPVVNLNTASASQLEALPGIGVGTAKRILEYRQKNGAFKKIEELMNVKGIGEKSFLKLKPLVTVAPDKSERTGGVQ
jgi:competence protein ComEA